MIQTQFPLTFPNYSVKNFAQLNKMTKDRVYNLRKNREKNMFWVCCIENEFVRGFEINQERYLIWREGGQKLQALIKYLEEQKKIYV